MENTCYMNRCVLKQKYTYMYAWVYVCPRHEKDFLECLLLPWHSSEYAYGHLGTSLNFQVSNAAQLI